MAVEDAHVRDVGVGHVPLDLRVVELEERVHVAPVPRVPRRSHDFQVLLGHRRSSIAFGEVRRTEGARKPPLMSVAARSEYGARMSPFRLVLLLVPVALAAAAAVAIASPPTARDSAAAVITPTRVDGVHLGDTHADLRAGEGRADRPGLRVRRPEHALGELKAPLKGSVTYTLQNPRKVTTITITGGAKARGVGIGATIAAIKAKFPHAKVDHSTDQVFQLTLVTHPSARSAAAGSCSA